MGRKFVWAASLAAVILLVSGFVWIAREHTKIRYVSGYVVNFSAVGVSNTVITVSTKEGKLDLWSDDPSIREILATYKGEKFDFAYRGIPLAGLNNLKIVKFRCLPPKGSF